MPHAAARRTSSLVYRYTVSRPATFDCYCFSSSLPSLPVFRFSSNPHSKSICMSSITSVPPLAPAMSHAPSAFDALMKNYRTSGSKRKALSSSPSGIESRTCKVKAENGIENLASSVQELNQKISEQGDGTSCSVQPLESARQDAPLNTSHLEVTGCATKHDLQEKINDLKSKITLLTKKPLDFKPVKIACLENGEKLPFLFVCLALDLIDKESGRNAITDIVCNMLRTVMSTTPADLVGVVYLLANKIAPSHEGVELGIGEAMIIKALSEAFGRTEKEVKKQYKELGDLGFVAKASRSSQSMMRKPDALTVDKVFSTFRLIAKDSGKDSQEKKKNRIKALLVAATDCEPQYLVRLLQSKLRIGFAEQTLLTALGQAAALTGYSLSSAGSLEEAAKIVKQVYSVVPVYEKIVHALLEGGVWELPRRCKFTVGIPVGPMLAKQTKDVSEIVNKFQNMEFTCEYKYDGERAQIHYLDDGSIEIYSRNAERNTGKFPDIVSAVPRFKKPSVTAFVIDCEIVAYDKEKQKILPFQILSTRARKNVIVADIKVGVCIFAFDILYLNGQPLLQEQLIVRREKLYSAFDEVPGLFHFASSITTNDLDEIQRFLDAAVDASCEGLIIKTLTKEATYEPAKRSHNWLKLKKDYLDGIGDSLDLVPIGAFHGRGKRAGAYGAFLLACFDPNSEEFQSICKIGSGFTEKMLEDCSNSLGSKLIPKPKSYYRCSDSINPDVWFEASEVWEVKAADLTISPVSRAAIGEVDPDKGISLRFPRLVRVRTDKAPEQATTSEQVAEMYKAQKLNHASRQNGVEDED